MTGKNETFFKENNSILSSACGGIAVPVYRFLFVQATDHKAGNERKTRNNPTANDQDQ